MAMHFNKTGNFIGLCFNNILAPEPIRNLHFNKTNFNNFLLQMFISTQVQDVSFLPSKSLQSSCSPSSGHCLCARHCLLFKAFKSHHWLQTKPPLHAQVPAKSKLPEDLLSHQVWCTAI